MIGLPSRIAGLISNSVRRYSTSAAVDKSVLSKLRKKTGFPLLKCKNALEKFDNRLQEAESWMKEQAQKEGWAKATKLQERPMSQGLVGVIQEPTSATVLEVNCETDFVARNENFQDLVSKLTRSCHTFFNKTQQDKVTMGKEALVGLTDSEGKTMADSVALLVGNLGENMAVRRAANIQAGDSSILGTYIHATGPRITIDGCVLGKFGAIVKLNKVPSDTESDLPLEVVAQQLCQHVIGLNPQEIGGAEDQPHKKRDEETKLIFQEFLLDPELTVKDFLKENSVEVQDFVRLECGEELEDDS